MPANLLPRVRILSGPHAGRVVDYAPSRTDDHIEVFLGTGIDEGWVRIHVSMVEQA